MYGTCVLENTFYNKFINYEEVEEIDDKIISSIKINFNELISLPKLLDLSDIIIGDIFNFNKTSNYLKKNKIINAEDNNLFNKLNSLIKINYNSDNLLKIFIFTDTLFNYYDKIYSLLSIKIFSLKLIIYGSKIPFDEKFLTICNLPNIKVIYSETISVEHNKVLPLFKGINFSEVNKNNIEIIDKIFEKSLIVKNHLLFASFNKKNGLVKSRCLADDFLKKNNIVNFDFINYEEYLYNLSEYKFCICPESLSINTYRIYECLSLRTIPICTKSVFTEYLKKKYPIIVLDKWEDLDLYSLNDFYKKSNWDNYDNLKLQNFLV